MPTRIAFCITELDPGGAERALTQLVLGLDRNDWEPYVFCLGPRGHFADVLESAGVPVTCLNARGFFSLPQVVFRLTRELRRLRPALVQTFLFHANILGRIAARLAGIPVVVSGIRVAERRNRWQGRVDRWTNRLVAANVCVSQGVADFSAQNVGLPIGKLVVIPNSVDFQRFSSAIPADLTPFGIPADSRVFISVGRLDRQKGLDTLIEAVGLMNPLPNDVHFLLVGDGPEANPLVAHVDRSGLSSRIHFAGRRNDVPQLLAASTALILPSRWEGMPNVVLEAMAAGLPVIATNVEGISELVQHGVTGLIVPVASPAELSQALTQILSSPSVLSSGGRKAQDIVQSVFRPQSVCDSYVGLYRRLLSPAGR